MNTTVFSILRFVAMSAFFIVATFLVILAWTGVWIEEVDPYTISIEYDCREVAKDPGDYTEQIIRECDKILPAKPQKTIQKTEI